MLSRQSPAGNRVSEDSEDQVPIEVSRKEQQEGDDIEEITAGSTASTEGGAEAEGEDEVEGEDRCAGQGEEDGGAQREAQGEAQGEGQGEDVQREKTTSATGLSTECSLTYAVIKTQEILEIPRSQFTVKTTVLLRLKH